MNRPKDRAAWCLDAIATATQNRMFLRDDPDCDTVACDAILANVEKVVRIATEELDADRHDMMCRYSVEQQRAAAAEAKLKAAGQMRLALAGMISPDVAARAWDAAQ